MASQPVTVNIGGYPFQCVRLAEADFRDVAGVYVILCVAQGGSWTVLDVGQSGELETRFDSHPRKPCWETNCPSKNIWVCVYPMPSDAFTKEQRLDREVSLRNQYKPPRGER